MAKRKKDKQRSTKHYAEIKRRAKQTPIKTRGACAPEG
jgi:hypothetical protein